MEPAKQTNTSAASAAKARTLVDDLVRYSEESGVRLRYTKDESGAPERISVIDTIVIFCECDNNIAARKYRDFEDKYKALNLPTHVFSGAGQRATPVARPSELISVLNALPRNRYPRVDAFHEACAKLVERYFNGELEEKKAVVSLTDKVLMINGCGITWRASDGYVDATAQCKASKMVKKDFNDWYNNKRTKTFLSVLSADTRIPVSELVLIGTQHKHTFVHRRVAYDIAQWISPEFAVKVNRWLDELLVSGSVVLHHEKSLEEIEAKHMAQMKAMSDSLEESKAEIARLRDNTFIQSERKIVDVLAIQMAAVDLSQYITISCLYIICIDVV